MDKDFTPGARRMSTNVQTAQLATGLRFTPEYSSYRQRSLDRCRWSLPELPVIAAVINGNIDINLYTLSVRFYIYA